MKHPSTSNVMVSGLIASLLIFTLPFSLAAWAADMTYYVANTGADTHDGLTEERPWKSIDKVNAATPSTAVVRFKRGDVFRGTIELAEPRSHVTFGAYGTGENPVISGSVVISDWVEYRGNIWMADAASLPNVAKDGILHLFVEGKLMTIARYPNTGWLRVKETDAREKMRFKDPDLAAYGKPDGYWNGATLRIRSWSQIFEIVKVKDYVASDGEVLLEHPLSCGGQPFLPLWGYYLDNVLGELDSPGEWHLDPETNSVYLWPPDDADPNNLMVEGSTYDAGLRLYRNAYHITMENLTFKHQTGSGIMIDTCDHITIKSNRFEYCGEQGTWIRNATNVNIAGNAYDHMLNAAIHAMTDSADSPESSISVEPQGTLIENNTIRNTGMIPGYGKSGEEHVSAIRLDVNGPGILLRQNTIENAGGHGIAVNSGGHTIENNMIREAMRLIDDGGGIQINSDNNRIIGNFVLETFGNRDESSGYATFEEGKGTYFPVMGTGIGSGKACEGNLIEGNTLAHNRGAGIRLSQWSHAAIRGNILYNNGTQAIFECGEDDLERTCQNRFEGNLLYSLSPKQKGMILHGPNDHGSFDHNTYCNPYSEILIQRDGRLYAFDNWQRTFPLYDANSKTSPVRFDEYILSEHGPNLIANSDFAADIEGWGAEGYFISHDTDKEGMEGAIKLAYEADDPHLETGPIAVNEGAYHLLRFSVIADAPGIVTVTVSDEGSEGREPIGERAFAVDDTRKEHTFVFHSPVTSSEAMLRFSNHASYPDVYWLDNVTFVAVNAVLDDAQARSKLFTNMTMHSQTILLEGEAYQDFDGNAVQGEIILEPYRSRILVLKEADLNTPVITGFDPGSGKMGDQIRISGRNLSKTLSVQFGGVNASEFRLHSDEEITAVVPAGAVTGVIRVTTPEGTAESSASFVLEPSGPPAITGFTPDAAPAGSEIRITGANFAAVTSVLFNGMSAAFVVQSENGILATVPENGVTGPLVVVTSEGKAASISDFTMVRLPADGDYHLSSSEGDDTSDGTSPEPPWKTLNRLNQALREKVIRPGNTILFKRGDRFVGTLYASRVKGTADQPILYSDYGEPSAPMPVISGYVAITGWEASETDGIHMCEADLSESSGEATDAPRYLFLDRKAMPLARHPDTGFLFVDEDSETSSRTIKDAELAHVPHISEWKGGQVVVRTDGRTYSNFEIESADASSLTVSGERHVIDENRTAINNGYFLQGKLQGLDAEGEWVFDDRAAKLHLVPPEDVACADLTDRVTVSRFQNGVELDDHTLIRNIRFEGYANAAFAMAPNTEGDIIDTCTVRNCHQGVSGSGISHSVISNNTFQELFDSGISFHGDVSHMMITGNRFENIGLHPGVEGQHTGICLESDEPEMSIANILSKNRMERVGYSGIMIRIGDPSGENPTMVEKNVIRHALAILADGASIHLEGAQGNVIRDNILKDAVGDQTSWNGGMGDAEQTANAFGIADFGDDMRNNQILHNTVIRHDEGFHAENKSKNTVFKGNLLYGNRACQARFSTGDQNTGSLGYQVFDNIFYCADPSQWAMCQEGEAHENDDFGTFDNNYYCNPYSTNRYAGEYFISHADKGDALIWRRQGQPPEDLLLNLYEYQQLSGQDANSKTDVEKWTVFRIGERLYELDERVGRNWISNSDFESGTYPWEAGGGKIVSDTREGLDGKCLKVVASGDYQTRVNNGRHIPFKTDAHYLLSFSGLRDVPLEIDIAPYYRLDEYTSRPIGERHRFPIGPGRHDYAYIFTVDATEGVDAAGNVVAYDDMRIFFHIGKGEPDCWLDNVKLFKITLKEALAPEERSKLFVNETDREKTFPLNDVVYKDLDGNLVTGESITLPPFRSKVLTFWTAVRENGLADAIWMLQVLAGLDDEGIHSVSDIDADGRVGLPEVISILQELVDGGRGPSTEIH